MINNPKPGQHVICVLKNSLVIEGVVDNWGVKECVLKSIDGENLLIITSPSEIVLIKVRLKEPAKPAEIVKDLEKSKVEIDHKFKETVDEPTSNMRLKKLSELRILAKQAEKAIIANKLRNHEPSDVGPVQYGLPNFNPIKIPK